jgi:hypothetical protein
MVDGLCHPVSPVSLNSFEQRIFDYWQSHHDEERFWKDKVRNLAALINDPSETATRLERELWHYFEERSGAVPAFRDAAQRDGLRRTSMRNLAELLLRVWTDLRPRKKPGAINPHN